MRNLLSASPGASGIAEILAATAGNPALPPLGDPAWTALRDSPAVAKWLAQCVELALAEADDPLPTLTDDLYADFLKTGARLPFENVYLERRRRLGRAAIGVLLDGDATRACLLPSFVSKLGGIMDEASWALPAHVQTQPSGKDPMTIDLFAADTANTCAELLAVFGAVIPAALAKRIRSRLRVQIFENYLNRNPPFFWTGLPMNWNAVCHQGVLGAALTIEDDHDLVGRLLARAADALPVFLSGFGNDGSSSEGPGYWSYGFGRFSELNAQLEHRTNGELSLFEGDEKIVRIARFGPLMTLAGWHFVNFSDGPASGSLGPSLVAYLGQRFAEPLLVAHGAMLYRKLADTGIDMDEQRCDFFNLSRIVRRAPSVEVLAAASAAQSPDVFFEDYGAVVARGTAADGNLLEFAAKGGHNAEHHNHNDCGSFILNLNGTPAIVEIGAPEYVRDYFKNEETRYTFLAARSLGHSVPLVNGCEQHVGTELAATVIECRMGTDDVRFVVDLTRCYPSAAGCRKLIRTFRFSKTQGRLEVSDVFELDEPGLVESMIICEASAFENDAVARIKTPGGVLRLDPMRDAELSGMQICAYKDRRGRERQVCRLSLRPPQPIKSGAIAWGISIDESYSKSTILSSA